MRFLSFGPALLALLAGRAEAAVDAVPGGFRFSGSGHAVLISGTNGSITSVKDGGGNEIASGGAAGLWSLTHYDGVSHDFRGKPQPTTTLTASAFLSGGATFTPTLGPGNLTLVYTDAAVGLTVTVTLTDRADGVDFTSGVTVAPGAGLTVLGVDLPASLRFTPENLQRFIAPNHSSDGVGMAFNRSFFQAQPEDNAATWKETPQADGGLGYRTLYGSSLVFESSDPVALGFTSAGTTWLGSATQTAWNGTDAVVNRPPASGQWDLLLIDSPKGPYFSGSKLGGGAGAGYLMRVGGNVNGQTAVGRSLDIVTAAVKHLALTPGGRTKIGILSMERGPMIGESWPSEVRIDEWISRISSELTGFDVVTIKDYTEMTSALAGGQYLAVLNPYGENIPVSPGGGVAGAVNALRSYVHGGGNWFEVGGHPFFFALQPVSYYTVEVPYPAAFADFFQLETVNGSASLFGVQPVLTNPSDPWNPSGLFVPGNLAWGADAAGGWFGRGFATHVKPAQSWQSPAVRLSIGHTAVNALGQYSVANGFTRGLQDKIPSAAKREAFKQSPLLRILGTAAELTARIPQLPAPSLIHFTQYLKGGFDKEYPDHLPVNASFGSEAGFQTFLSSAKAAGHLTMPYTNPTFWGVDPKGPTWTAISNDDPLLRNLNGAIHFEEYFGEGGFTATPWHPAVRAANEKTIDLFNGDPGNHYQETDYQVDFLFQDQVGARSWQYDNNPQSPEPQAYVHGLIALNAEDSGKMPVSTENGFDRLINFESQFCGLAWGLAPTPGAPFWRRFLSDRYDPATWEIFPLAQHLAHDKVAFAFNNLGASTSTDETVAWALGLGYGMTCFFDEADLNDTSFREWLAWIARVQKSVGGRYIGGGINSFDHQWGANPSTPDNGTITASYGPVGIVANLGPQNLVSGGRTIAPHGFVATAPDMIAARIIQPGGSAPVRFVAESSGSGTAEFWIHSVGGQEVTIELPPGLNGSFFVSVANGAAVPRTIVANQLTVTLPAGAEPTKAYLWHGTVSHFTHVVNPANHITITGYTGPADVVIPGTIGGLPVVEVGVSAFQNQISLTSVEIPDSVTTLGDYSFAGCTGLTGVDIPDNVTIVGSHAFDGCGGLTTVSIGSGVTSIGFAAFQGCSSLTGVTVPNNVTSLGGNAFFNCTGLLDVTLGTGITSIGTATFQGCTGLASISIPNSVTNLGNYAFFGCGGLTSVSFGTGLTHIGTAAFQGCVSLASVTLPGNVANIGNFAFFGCTGLSGVTLGSGVASIGQGAFQLCSSLHRITIPASVTSIGGFAFAGGNSLNEIYFLGSPPSASLQTFDGQTGLGIFHLPTAPGWTNPWLGRVTAPWNPVTRNLTFSSGVFGFTVTGSGDFSCIVESSVNLTTWQSVGSVTLSGGTATFSDAAPPSVARRYYRLKIPQ